MINDKESWYGPFRHFLIASACTFHVETSRRQAKFDHLTLTKSPLGVTSVSKIGLTIYTWLLGMTSNHWFIVQSHSSSLVTLKMLESRAPLLAAKAWHLPNGKEKKNVTHFRNSKKKWRINLSHFCWQVNYKFYSFSLEFWHLSFSRVAGQQSGLEPH